MEQKTTTTKAWNGAAAAGIASWLLRIVEQTWMIDLPPDVETAIIALVTAGTTWFFVWRFPNKPIPDQPEGDLTDEN